MTWKARTRITVGLVRSSSSTGAHRTIPHDPEIHKIYADMGESNLHVMGATPDLGDIRGHLLDLVSSHGGWSIGVTPTSSVSVDGIWTPYDPSALSASFTLLKSGTHYTVNFEGASGTGTIAVSYYAEVEAFQE